MIRGDSSDVWICVIAIAKTAERAIPALSAGVTFTEEQNRVLNAALQETELRIELLVQHLEDKKGECAAA